ncbi:UNVERIFIED_CONTAM: hypothetical protein GTU68_064888 [Idotea baltica]|nr:hypothetical protein [Idotea baltica]
MTFSQNSPYYPFTVIGISFHKADIGIRERFSISDLATEQLLKEAKCKELEGIMVLSTCNRTEIYGNVDNHEELLGLLFNHTWGSFEKWEKVGWVKTGKEAMEHLLMVGSGLDSQILGDFQIIGQIKRAFEKSQKIGTNNGFLERLVNLAIKTSKRIKNETTISTGSASVAFAAITAIKKWAQKNSAKRILLLGTGEIGKATCSNLVKHLPDASICILNRTIPKAQVLAERYDLETAPWETLNTEIAKAQVIISATAAAHPILHPNMIAGSSAQLLIDLAMPRNIDPAVGDLPNVTLLDLDQLVAITQLAMARREAELPKAQQILKKSMKELSDWLETREYSHVLKALKDELGKIHQSELSSYKKKHPELDTEHIDVLSQRFIQKITNRFASHFNKNQQKRANGVETINNVFELRKEG